MHPYPTPRVARWPWATRALVLFAAMSGGCFPEYGFPGSGGSGGNTSGGAGGGTGGNVVSDGGGGGLTTGGGGSGGTPGCETNDDCAVTPATSICDVSAGECVECLPTDDPCELGLYCAPTKVCLPGCNDDADC